MITSTSDQDRAFERRLVADAAAIRAFVAGLADASEVDDLCQETMARALRYRRSCRPDRPLLAWARGIAFRVYLDHRTARSRAPGLVDVEGMPHRAESHEATAERRERVDRALSLLTAREREVVVRFHSRGESVAEIATALRTKVGTVKSLLHRARNKMAKGE